MSSADNPDRSRSLGDYRLVRRIAVGGMGEIFAAEQPTRPDQPRVAVKVLLPHCARDPELVRRFADEARLNMAVVHPNLVKVIEYQDHGPQPFLVMELVEGTTLDELAARVRVHSGRIPDSVSLYVVAEVLRALTAVHTAVASDGRPLHIVHRDVTPQNILVSTTGEIKLGDFGIARSALRSARTRTGMVLGKLRYLAPEQANGSRVDARTDLYCLGLILFELLAGQPFFGDDHELALLRAVCEPTRIPLGRLRKGIAPELDELVQRALRRFPEERYPSAARFLEEVRAVSVRLGLMAGAPDLAALLASAPPRPEPSEPIAPQVLAREAITVDLATRSEPQPGPGSTETTLSLPGQAFADRTPTVRLSSARAGRATTWVGLAVLAAVLGIFVWQRASTDPGTSQPVAGIAPSAADAQPPPPAATVVPAAPAAEHGSKGLATQPRPKPNREPLVPPAPEPTTLPEPTADLVARPPPPADGAALAARMAALETSLATRGISRADLGAPLRDELDRAGQALANGRFEEATTGLAGLEPAINRLAVDAAFVEQKLKRLHAAIRAADRQRVDAARLDDLARRALEEYMAGRLDAANRQLNQVAELLEAAR